MQIEAISETPNQNTIKITLSEKEVIINQILTRMLQMDNLNLLIAYLI